MYLNTGDLKRLIKTGSMRPLVAEKNSAPYGFVFSQLSQKPLRSHSLLAAATSPMITETSLRGKGQSRVNAMSTE